MKKVIFDLFDTILDKDYFDYFLGLRWLYDTYYSNSCSYECLESSALEFRMTFMLDRSKTNKEIPFIKQLQWFENHFKSVKLIDKDEIEWQFFRKCRNEIVANNIKDFLEYLLKWGFEISILSNSIFSSKTLRRYLKHFGLDGYFKSIYSTADIIERKPSLDAFKYVIEKEEITFEEPTFFIGNSLTKDIAPSKHLGFISIFRNHLNEDYDGISFVDYKDLIDIFSKKYMFINNVMDRLSMVDGPGNRAVVFTQGCKFHCEGCHNPSSWDFRKSNIIDIVKLSNILKEIAITKKITISGGEPLNQENAIIELIKMLPEYEFCIYTGYDLEDVNKEILNNIRYIKVGRFKKEKLDLSKPYFGSSNQRFIDLKEGEK